MRLAGITIVRNECDIIEAFVRHNAAVLDRLYILDNDSGDGTLEILQRLAASRLPIEIKRDEVLPFYQAAKTTALAKNALADAAWDCLLPLDGDEFLVVDDRGAFEKEIASLAPDEAGLLVSDQYAPTESDDMAELDSVRRIIHRIVVEPALPPFHGKVIVPHAIASLPNTRIGEGNHHISVANARVRERWLTSARIAHFPIRSIDQFLAKVVTTRLAWLSRGDYRSSLGQHIAILYAQLRDHPEISPRHLLDAAFTYVDSYLGPTKKTYQRKLVRDPVVRRGDALSYLDLAKVSALPRILEFAEQIAKELGQAKCETVLNMPSSDS